jgi:hypothetical protein
MLQSDPGTENQFSGYAITLIRHTLDPTLAGTIQIRYKRTSKNVKSEITWSQLRRRWSPGFEDVLDWGLNNELYNPDNNDEA